MEMKNVLLLLTGLELESKEFKQLYSSDNDKFKTTIGYELHCRFKFEERDFRFDVKSDLVNQKWLAEGVRHGFLKPELCPFCQSDNKYSFCESFYSLESRRNLLNFILEEMKLKLVVEHHEVWELREMEVAKDLPLN